MATHLPLPVADAGFIADLTAFLQGEEPARFLDMFQPFVSSGGTHGTGAGLTGTPDALVAYPAGIYTTETGSITYADASTTWVIADDATTGNLGTYTRVTGTHYLIDGSSGTLPALPSGCVQLMKVTTAGGAVTAVQDLRLMSPVKRLANGGIVFSSAYATLQEAVDALALTGGVCYIEPGEYTLADTLRLGDGGAASVSTRQGIFLVGLGAPYSDAFGYTDDPAVKITWAGGADPVIAVLGPLAGWGVSNLSIDGADAASHGILVTSAQYGDCRNIAIKGCETAGIGSTTVATFGGAANTSSFHNKWTNVFVDAPGDFGISLDSGSATSNTGFNTFDNCFIVVSGNGIGLNLGACSNNFFINLHCSLGGGAATGVNFAYDNGQSPLWPAANFFFGLEPHDKVLTQSGTPGAGLSPNWIVGVSKANGALPIDIEGVIVFDTTDQGHVVLQPSHNSSNPTAEGDVVVGSTATATARLIPAITDVSDIGSETLRFRNLYVMGGVAGQVISTTTTPYTVLADDFLIKVDATAGAKTVNLPTAVGIRGRQYIIKKIDASGNAVTVEGDGAETVDGAANATLAAQWDAVTVMSDNANWLIVAIGP